MLRTSRSTDSSVSATQMGLMMVVVAMVISTRSLQQDPGRAESGLVVMAVIMAITIMNTHLEA